MTDCTRLSDRMAAVAHRRAAWSADEAAHLASCRDCAAEWRVFQVGTTLGAEVARTLPADFLATRVVAAPAAQIALLPELESLDATDLETVLQLLPDPDGSAEIRILDELTDDEMTRLLNGLEG